MLKPTFTHAAAALAAAAITLVLFSSVASLADNDKAAVLAARNTPLMIAAQTDLSAKAWQAGGTR